MGVEGGVAWKYWNEFAKAVPLECDFSKPVCTVKRQDSLQVKIVKCLKKRLFKDSRSPSVRALSYGRQPQRLYF